MTAEQTLRTGRDFARVVRSGAGGSSDGLRVFVARNTAGGPARLGLSIRASAGSAVTRNRAKRRLREAWRRVEVADGIDVVVQAAGPSARLSFQELENHLAKALASAEALR